MPTSESVDAFHRTLSERYSVLKKAIDELIRAVTFANPQLRGERAMQALQATKDLSRMLTVKDQPAWLKSLEQALASHAANIGQSEQDCFVLMIAIASQFPAILGHQWKFDDTAGRGIDFDQIFEDCRKAGGIPDLFDQLIAALEKLAASEDVDSRKAVKQLEALIETLKRNRNGSYFATVTSWDFVVSVMRNWLWEELARAPGIGGLMKALRKSLEDMNKGMKDLHNKIDAKVQDQAKATGLEVLRYHERDLQKLTVIDTACTVRAVENHTQEGGMSDGKSNDLEGIPLPT